MSKKGVVRNASLSNRIVPIALSLFLFLMFFLFFTRVSPAYIFDWDDWNNLTWTRSPFPAWGEWNPAKVFPDTFMPFCGMVGGLVINPFLNDYIQSIMLAFAGAFSLCITGYLLSFYLMIRKCFDADSMIASGWTLAFALLHFTLFANPNGRLIHMLYAPSTTYFFNYTIPDILNAAFVMLFIAGYHKTMHKEESWLKKGFLVLGAYLCMCSNLYSAVILASYVGASLVTDLVAWCRGNPRPPFPTFVREHAFELAIIALWVVVQVFESHGGRASSLAADGAPLLTRLGTSASLFAKTLLGVKKRYLLLFVIAVVIWVVVVKKTGADRSPRAVDIVRLGLALLLTTIYLWLLGATTDPENLRRPDAVFGTLFFLLMFIVLPFGYLVSTHRQINVCLPILLFVMACSAPISYQCCTPAFQADIDPALAKSIGDDIVEQVIQASERGDELVDVAVPNMSYVGCPKPGRIPNALVANSESYVPDEGNWPLVNSPRESPSGVGVALYRHGIISKPIAVYFVKDVRVNEKYGIPVLTE